MSKVTMPDPPAGLVWYVGPREGIEYGYEGSLCVFGVSLNKRGFFGLRAVGRTGRVEKTPKAIADAAQDLLNRRAARESDRVLTESLTGVYPPKEL